MDKETVRNILSYLPEKEKEKIIKEHEQELKDLFLNEVKKEIHKSAKEYYKNLAEDLLVKEYNSTNNPEKSKFGVLVKQAYKEVYDDKDFIDGLLKKVKRNVKSDISRRLNV